MQEQNAVLFRARLGIYLVCILSKYENKKYGLSGVKKQLQWLIKAYWTTEKYKVYHSSP